ncbi:putative MFS myo-inositol transporter [Aureobasidium pullulans]|nr:putative MFS myo-inositol transporter [Aureobasidium pullulans]
MHDESEQPLIVDENDDGVTSRPEVSKQDANKLIWLLTLSAGLSGLLFGYDTGVISSTLVSIHEDLGRTLTTLDLSMITSSTSLLALIASPLAGHFADSLGRRPVISVACGLFIFGALFQSAATNVWTMVLGRAVVGAAVGGASAVVPLYIAEISPADRRGQLVSVQSLFITGGQVVAYVVGWAVMGRWRWSVGAGAVPAILQAGLLVGMPESPRWLVLKGRDDEAAIVFSQLGHDDCNQIVSQVKHEVKEEQLSASGSMLNELITIPANRRALIIAAGLQALQQLSGFNSLMYFSATIFALVGFTSPIGTSLSISVSNFVFTLLAFAIIDRVGRRRILLYSIPFMILGLASCSLAFMHIDASPSDTVAPSTAVSAPKSPSPWSLVLLCSLIFYVASYACGLGCVPWQQSELFSLSVRSMGSGLATATNWTSNFIVGATFLPMMHTLGPSATFLVYVVVCLIGYAWVWRCYPETKNLELEQVKKLLENGWGVKANELPNDLEECFSGGELDAVISIKGLCLHLARPLLHFRVLVNLISTSFPCCINSPQDIASRLQLINLVHADQVDGRTILLHRFELRDPLREGSRSECTSDYTVGSVGTGSGKSVSHRCRRVGARLDRETVSRPRRFAVVINGTITRAVISPRACRSELKIRHRAYFCYKTCGGTPT